MYWEENRSDGPFVVPDDVVDLVYAISARCLPIDHAHALAEAVTGVLPWLKDEPTAGIHQIHVADSGNGWYRPEDPDTEVLYVSRRTKMMLRLPKGRVEDAQRLCGRTLDIGGFELTVGEARVKLFTALPTLLARYVVTPPSEEDKFLRQSALALRESGVTPRKLLCGRLHPIRTPAGAVQTRSLMVADLEPGESVRLQQQGLGEGRHLGCGLFIPQKDIKPVKPAADEE